MSVGQTWMKTVAAGSNASAHAQKGRKNTANKHVCRSVGFRLLTEVLAALLTLPLDHSSFTVCLLFLPFVFMFPANGFSRDSLCYLFWSGQCYENKS